MFSLRLFGAPGVDGPEGPIGGRAAQRHPLALLALLATAPSGTVGREKLLGLLWPDSDTERARGLLNVAVHALRRALGEGAIRSVGGSVQLDAAVVGSDLARFTDALAAGDAERAVAAYAGPFLDGFYLDAEEFDRWAEGERARLAGLYAGALERLAEAAEEDGDRVAAVAWWRRRAAADPCDSRVALRLMRALAVAGDRAGAIQHARVHEALLRESVGAAPPPEVAALAEELRTVPSGPAPGEAGALAHEPAPPALPSAAAPAEPSGREAAPPAGGRGPVRRLRRPTVMAAGVAVLLVIATGTALTLQRSEARSGSYRGRPPPLPQGPVVAVLPFADRSPARNEAWRAEEMSAEMITALARLPAMRVIARTSAFAFRDSSLDVREIGRRLGARYVLEGSVGQAGDRLHVRALLVSVDSGYQVWAGSYDREARDVVAVQDEIARGVVGALRPRTAAPRRLVRPTTDPAAYELYQQARHAWGQRTAGGLAQATDLLQQAVRRDPSFAQAYAGLAECHALLVTYGAQSPAEGYSLARDAAERALALEPALAEAHAALALVRLYYERDWGAAGREFARAIRENPGNSTARRWYATYLAYQGRFDEALLALEQAQRLDPFSAPIHATQSSILYYAGRYDEAIDRARAALMIDPRFWPAHAHIAAAYAQQGRYPDALDEIERARRLSGGHLVPEALHGYVLALSGRRDEAHRVIRALEEQRNSRYLSPAYIAAIHTGLGETDAALDWLERAFESNDDWVIYLAVEPSFEPLRGAPRFARLLRRIRASG